MGLRTFKATHGPLDALANSSLQLTSAARPVIPKAGIVSSVAGAFYWIRLFWASNYFLFLFFILLFFLRPLSSLHHRLRYSVFCCIRSCLPKLFHACHIGICGVLGL